MRNEALFPIVFRAEATVLTPKVIVLRRARRTLTLAEAVTDTVLVIARRREIVVVAVMARVRLKARWITALVLLVIVH